jgi:hypothetical protein
MLLRATKDLPAYKVVMNIDEWPNSKAVLEGNKNPLQTLCLDQGQVVFYVNGPHKVTINKKHTFECSLVLKDRDLLYVPSFGLEECTKP